MHLLFSIVTVVYNDAKNVGRTIESVLSQDYSRIQYIVIDGASTDRTLEVIRRFSDNLTWVSEADNGIYDAMNKGLSKCSGDYVIFMNSGDIFTDKAVLSKVEKAICNSTVVPDLVYGNYRESRGEWKSPIIPARPHHKAWYGAFASHQSTFYRVSFLREKGYSYDLNYRIAADYKLNLQVISTSECILKLDVCISDFDITGVSNQNRKLGRKEADMARREVLHFSWFQRKMILCAQICALALKTYLRPLYHVLRYS
jgi:glycosyltransferase, group 2 family